MTIEEEKLELNKEVTRNIVFYNFIEIKDKSEDHRRVNQRTIIIVDFINK